MLIRAGSEFEQGVAAGRVSLQRRPCRIPALLRSASRLHRLIPMGLTIEKENKENGSHPPTEMSPPSTTSHTGPPLKYPRANSSTCLVELFKYTHVRLTSPGMVKSD